MEQKKSIRRWLLVILAGFTVIPLLILGGVLSWQFYSLELEKAKVFQNELTLQASGKIELFMHEQEQRVVSLLQMCILKNMTHEEMKQSLTRFLATSADSWHGYVFNEVSFIDSRGQETFRVSRVDLVKNTDLKDRSEAEEFRRPAAEKGVYYSPVYFDEKTGEPEILISIAAYDLQKDALQGVLVVEMSLKRLWNLVADIRIGESGSAYITNASGMVVVHPNPSVVLKGTRFNCPDEPCVTRGVEGQRAIVAGTKMYFGAQEMTFVTEVSTKEALKHVSSSLVVLLVILLITVFSATGLGFVLVRRLVRPVESLARTARMISDGDVMQLAEVESNDEFGELSNAFNVMTSRLLESMRSLENEKNFVRSTLESLTHPFYVIDVKDYTIKLANSAANFGFLSGNETCHKLTHMSDVPCSGSDHPCAVKEVKRTKKPVVVEHIHYPDGVTPKTFEVYGYPIFGDDGEVVQIIEYNIDITARKILEEQLQQSQKLEAIGSLAGGVAHDFNNHLTTVLGYAELALQDMTEDDPLRETLEVIYEAGDKASDLTRQLLAFSRKQVMSLRVINLNDLVSDLIKMLGRLIGEHIVIKLILGDVGNIKGDPGQVEQIIMNLAVNARDAMPQGGNLYLETQAIDLDEEYCLNHADVEPGAYVVLSVTDTGEGLKPEIKERIFDPFFTTKAKGEGTGLGLATVYGIVKQLGGHIFVYSELGSGSTFKIYFPMVSEGIEQLEHKEPIIMVKGTETVLVVDDEPSIRNLIYDSLQPLGYNVIKAASGEAALEIGRAVAGNIDLLLTDVIMPEMNGKDLAKALSEIRPEMKVLFMSGYTDNVIATQGILKPGVFFMNKPLVPSQMTRRIREILDDKTGGRGL